VFFQLIIIQSGALISVFCPMPSGNWVLERKKPGFLFCGLVKLFPLAAVLRDPSLAKPFAHTTRHSGGWMGSCRKRFAMFKTAHRLGTTSPICCKGEDFYIAIARLPSTRQERKL